jgi:hypothetical protein
MKTKKKSTHLIIPSSMSISSNNRKQTKKYLQRKVLLYPTVSKELKLRRIKSLLAKNVSAEYQSLSFKREELHTLTLSFGSRILKVHLVLGAAGRHHKAYMGYLSTVLGDRSGFSKRGGGGGWRLV